MVMALLHACGCTTTPVANFSLITRALQTAGVEVKPLDSEEDNRYVILLFEEPDGATCRFLRETSRDGETRIVAVGISRPLEAQEAWRLLAAGAADIIIWNDAQDGAERVKARLERWAMVDALMHSSWIQKRMVGASMSWRRKLLDLIEAARFTTSPVLLMGESGTGKELVANLIHEFDPRPAKASLVVLDCTTIMPELSGSEFFGHERGAFTGAVAQRAGAFAQANKGTLFLDEIGELPLPMQAQLLRVIQEHTYKLVGGNAWQRTEFRLVCATNRNLGEQVQRGEFRADLYFRIASLVFTLPPLRERTGDILPLVRHFLREMRPHEEPPALDEAVREYFLRHDYRGNIRELKQRVARLMHRYVGGGLLTVGSIPPDERPSFMDDQPDDWQGAVLEQIIRRAIASGSGLKKISRATEDIAVRIAVDDAQGNLQRAAQALGVTDRALQMRRANRTRSEQSRWLNRGVRTSGTGC